MDGGRGISKLMSEKSVGTVGTGEAMSQKFCTHAGCRYLVPAGAQH